MIGVNKVPVKALISLVLSNTAGEVLLQKP